MKQLRLSVFVVAVLMLFILPSKTAYAESDTVYNGVDYSDVYNKDYYLKHNPDVKAAIGNNPRELIRHFVEGGMNEGRVASPNFDVQLYKATYSDLRAAFGNNTRAYYYHYMYGGKYEGRTAIPDACYNGVDYSDVYNKDYYLKHNPDVKAAIGNNPRELIRHFVEGGMNEGRQASPNFDVQVYKASYYDLRAAFGNNTRAYYYHYMNGGIYEGRVAVPDSCYNGVDYSDVYNKDYYLNHNQDIRAAIGNNPRELIRHFVEGGMNEGREASPNFDVRLYKATYSDLSAAFGNNTREYYYHYMYGGQYEGRTAIPDACYNGVDYSDVYNKDYYLNQNTDIKAAIGDNPRELIRHFVEGGMTEGRVASKNFNVTYYKSQYTDLQAAFGSNLRLYYLHYMYSGKYEGRVAVPGGWQTINGRKYFYDSNNILISKTGIDVSHHQGTIDWAQVKNDGIDFAIIRIGYGSDYSSQDDRTAVYNMNECERLGIPYGVYLYSYAQTTADVDSEVAHTLRMISGRNPVMGVYYDMENYSDHGSATTSDLNTFSLRYLQQIKAAGYKAGLYANKAWLTNVLTDSALDNYDIWVSQWADELTYQGYYIMWQYTNTGSVSGISGTVDMDIYIE